MGVFTELNLGSFEEFCKIPVRALLDDFLLRWFLDFFAAIFFSWHLPSSDGYVQDNSHKDL